VSEENEIEAQSENPVVEREPVTEEQLADLGISLTRDFPGTTASDLRRYPVLTEGGWQMVIKNPTTLQTIHREPWKLLGPIRLTSHGLEI
jgi:hypothetical protein